MEISALSEFDLYLYHQGTNYHTYQMLGAHFIEKDGVQGVRFAVWAPHAKGVSVVGDFNDWDTRRNSMKKMPDGEIWITFIPGLKSGEIYKYAIDTRWGGPRILKADPYGFFAEVKPQTASKIYDLRPYQWQDQAWQEEKKIERSYGKPMLIYEVHLGSWRRNAEGEYLTYRQAAEALLDYVRDMNYTHIEFMPLCEHPFDGSWGYQATGYYSVTSRYGTPDEFRYLVDRAHQMGIGVIMDWVPGHFCKDDHGLRHFDGVNLYESDNETRAENREWGTTNFDYGRTEVQSFLISNAMFWFEEYHIDGLRIDAVANMLYLNYAREDGEWEPNKYGDTGNLEAMEFLRKLNEAIFKYHPDALMLAEESTSWPLISKPVYMGGMGFNYKWNMGWMNDMLKYMSLDPIYRKWNHDKVTFSFMYAFSENYVLPLSHDEVVHGKCSLINKMPGDYWQKFAGLRAFYGYWMAHPGKKLLFMGSEFGQFIEWKYDDSLDWHLIQDYPMHQKMLEYSRALNGFYGKEKAFWQVDFDWEGFEWIDCKDTEHSVISFIRKAEDPSDFIVAVCNFTPDVYHNYRIGMPEAGVYEEVFNSDAAEFGGSDVKNAGELCTEEIYWHERAASLSLTIPPLAVIYLRLKAQKKRVSTVKRKEAETVAEKNELPAPAKAKRSTRVKNAESAAPVSEEKTRKTPVKRTRKTAAVKADLSITKDSAELSTEEKTAKKRTAVKTAVPAENAAVPAEKKRGRPKASAKAEPAEKKSGAKKTATRKKAITPEMPAETERAEKKTTEKTSAKKAVTKKAVSKKAATKKDIGEGAAETAKKTASSRSRKEDNAAKKEDSNL